MSNIPTRAQLEQKKANLEQWFIEHSDTNPNWPANKDDYRWTVSQLEAIKNEPVTTE